MNTTDKLPETKSISSHQAYTEGFVQGVRFCEKYGIPANPTPLSNTKEQVPLFTTEDGVGIKNGQDYWHIVSDWTPQKETAQEFGRDVYQVSSLIRFSTKEAAEQYILENKPCLSLNDLLEVWDTSGLNEGRYYGNSPLYKNFESKAKQKLSQ